MDLNEARQVLRDQHHAVLATWRSGGTPQLSPVTVGVDRDGYPVISSRRTAYKVKNVRRDPRAYLCVFPDGFYGRWVQLDGTVEVIDLPEAMEPLIEYYRSIAGELPDWDDYRTARASEQRVLLRMTVTRAVPDRAG